MTDSPNDFTEEIDTLLDEVISVEQPDEPQTEKAHNTDGWFKEEFTFRDRHDDEYIIDQGTSEIEQYATEIPNGESHATMAEQLIKQYVEVSERQFIMELVAAATFYCACKINGGAVDPTEVPEIGPAVVTRKHLLRRSKEIATTLGLDPSAFFDPGPYVDRYCEELGLEPNVREMAHELIENVEDQEVVVGKSPSGLAAGAVYWASIQEGDGINQDVIAEVANVSTVTIRNRYQDLAESTN